MRGNLTEEERKAALEAPFLYTREEQEFIERCFTGYLFFEHEQDEMGRDGVSTECTRCGRKVWWTAREWRDFKKETGAKERSCVLCPDCGAGVTVYARGRLRGGPALDEHRQVVLLRVIDGALRAIALTAWKHHGRYKSNDAEGDVKAAYYFAPGKCQKWTRRWVWSDEIERVSPTLIAQKTVTEPFAECSRWLCRYSGHYAVHGVDQIAKSPLKYCAAEQYFNLYDDDTAENTMGLLTYLGLWTRYPRIEQLTKAGSGQIIEDAINGNMNSRALNWRAKSMPAFFRLDKGSAKRLLAEGIGRRELEALEVMRCGGVTMEQALMVRDRLGDKGERKRCSAALREIGESPLVLARYLEKHQHKNARLWLDYIDAAKKLGYDLTRRDVAFPKNLRGAHDAAIETINYERNEAARKAYEKRYKKLKKKYSFSAMGLSIVVPEDDREIINEGKTLHHCVGGYAERHMVGAATILFLRKEKTPQRSYITIEMCGAKGNDIRQIHGYRNEYKGAMRIASPQERHGAFIDLWISWLKAGSRRDKSGRPILPAKGERTA
nr:MAG TPA: PcfJ like protein [Caudoviricetes sp.]